MLKKDTWCFFEWRRVILLTLLALAALSSCHKAQENHEANSFLSITGGDTDEEKAHWNSIHSQNGYIFGKEADGFLKENVGRLPLGTALVLPMEQGRNAVFLAKKGFNVTGIDFSDAALTKARHLAKENGVVVTGINGDLNEYNVEPEKWDVIAAMDFYRPRLIAQIKRGLKHGGVVVTENYTTEQMKNEKGPKMRRDYLLKPGELRALFSDFEILVYRETNDGSKALASLVARKR
ncbi:MAG: class I SAM-dependent methyltransferase [Bdellovibrionota bacterium]